MRRGFTMIEMLLAVLMVGVLTTLSVLTFQAVTHGWMVSQDYMDKVQRTDYALNQVVSGLKSMYYPHDGKQDDRYGFVLTDNGDGENPDDSDVIEWSKRGTALVGNKSAVADTVHRVQLMVLEEGNSDYKERINKTGLYARLCGDVALQPKEDEDDSPDDGYGFGNDELYQPVLIADGVVGFNCRVLAEQEDEEGGIANSSENDKKKFEDEFSESNSVPYKVELTFYVEKADDSFRSRTVRAPMMRIIRLPIHEQSKDGAQMPSEDEKGAAGALGGRRGGGGGAAGGGAGGAGGGGGGGG